MQPLIFIFKSAYITAAHCGEVWQLSAKDNYAHTGDLPLPQLWYVHVFLLLCSSPLNRTQKCFHPDQFCEHILYNSLISIVTLCRGLRATEDKKFQYKSIGTVCKTD